jgi:3-hydroxymyristoyl/3-hydroxydecanoyl-(acyl carrier protein) dehydratase
MRFLFVDRITRLDPGSSARVEGTRTFGLDEPLRYEAPVAEAAPGVVSEAIGQLASWLCLARNDFTARPVFLFADSIEVLGATPLGVPIQLSADIGQLDAETVTFSGEASVDGRVLVRMHRVSGYFMPLADLEDPAVTRARFAAMMGEGLRLEGTAGEAFAFDRLVAPAAELAPGQSIRTTTRFDAALPFYADHFPRFPVTPIVMLNEAIGAAARQMFHAVGKEPHAHSIRGIKIKSFVRPGDQCEVRIEVQGPSTVADGVRTVAELIKDGKRILRGTYDYVLTEKKA